MTAEQCCQNGRPIVCFVLAVDLYGTKSTDILGKMSNGCRVKYPGVTFVLLFLIFLSYDSMADPGI